MSNRLRMQMFTLGQWMTNCYVLWLDQNSPGAGASGGKPCWIIDAGFEPGPMIQFIREHDLQPMQVILTHGHLDHIAGLDIIRAAWPNIPILIHPLESEFLTSPELNLSEYVDEPITAPQATGFLEQGQVLKLGDQLSFEVRHTPGHSPGGIALIQKETNTAIVGDTLFSGSVGRVDFPTSDPPALLNSIRSQLYTLPDAMRVFPGHGPATTIAQERTSNPYVKG